MKSIAQQFQGLPTAEQLREQLGGNCVVVLTGGPSAEREISLLSGLAVCEALKRQGFSAPRVDINDPNWIATLFKHKPDCVFIAVHGRFGEDGAVQGLLECANLCYTGSGVLASALGLDKLYCKDLWQTKDLPTPDYCLIDENSSAPEILDRMGGALMVKPARQGSSLGMSRVRDANDLHEAWKIARRYDEIVFAEQLLAGPEYTVAILADISLPIIRIESRRGFYDYEAKYSSALTRYLIPCGLSAQACAEMQDLALRAFHAVGACGWGRVDLMMDGPVNGKASLIEINTVPGLTKTSLLPMSAADVGLDFDAMTLAILASSVLPQTRGL